MAKRLVAGIVRRLPAGTSAEDVSIGVRPLSVNPDGPSALPDAVRDDLSGRMLEAVLNADERFTLKTRDLINEVYGTLKEYYRDDGGLKGLLKDAGAHVEIFCGTSLETGVLYRISLSCTAEWLATASTLMRTHADVSIRANRVFEVVVEDLAENIVRGLPTAGKLGQVQIEEGGERSELSEYVGRHFSSVVAERMVKQAGWGTWRAIGGDQESEQVDAREYDLSAELWCQEDERDIELNVYVKDAEDDALLFRRTTRLPMASLPSGVECGASGSDRRYDDPEGPGGSAGEDEGEAEVPQPDAAGRDSIGVREQQYLFGMEKASQAADYEEVVEYWEKLAELSGTLPAEARYYLGAAYMELGRNEEADQLLIEYLAELPRTDGTAERFKEVLDRLLELESRLEADDAAYERATAAGTAESYRDYLTEHTSGRHAEEARQRQAEAKDDDGYERAHSRGTAAWYEQYLREHPNGRHVEEARRQHAHAMDDEAYRQAAGEGTSAAYDEYLTKHPDGRHAEEARRAQAAIREDDAAYERARAAGTPESYAEYLREHPEGRHAEEARRAQASIRQDAAAYERARETGTAESYGDYLSEYPSGRHVEQARQRQADAKDDEAYELAQTRGTAAWYEQYLREYPNGRHAEEARQLLADAEDRDDEAYAKAKAIGTWAAYKEYLRAYPSGQYVEAARRLQSATGGQVVRRGDIASDLLGIAWNGTRFVAVGENGAIVHSPDGQVWTAAESGTSETLRGVAWSGARFVAVGQPGGLLDARGVIVHSLDGQVWTVADGGPSAPLKSVVWTGMRFVAVGSLGPVVHSLDGRVWTAIDESDTLPSPNGIAWNGTRFIAVSGSIFGGIIDHSLDGQVWTRVRDIGISETLRGVAWSGTRFVAVGDVGAIVHSADGQAWTAAADSDTLSDLYGVAWSGTRFVAVGDVGAIVHSADGQAWTAAVDSDTLSDLYGVAWSGTRFVAVGENGTIVHSADGETWTAATIPANDYRGVAWNGTRFVAVGEGGAIVHSLDGQVWTAADSGTSKRLESVVSSRKGFVAVGGDRWRIVGVGVIVRSLDGQVWTKVRDIGTSEQLGGVAWNGSLFVAVGKDGAIVHSPDGAVWTAADSDTSETLYGVAWNGALFVAVGEDGTIVHSPDGQVWTRADSGTAGALYGVAWNGTRFVAVGWSGAIVHSPDGTVWTGGHLRNWPDLYGVTWNGKRFIAVGWDGAIVHSPDGRVWAAAKSGSSEPLWGVAWNGTRFVAVGDRGTIIAGPESVPTSMTPVVEAREGERAELLAPGERFRDCETCPELVVVRAGSYMMGSPASEEGRTVTEGPQHQVAIAGPLAVGAYEVTREQFGSFATATGYIAGDSCRVGVGDERKERVGTGWRDPGYEQTDEHPVVCVSWEDAQAYVKWLSRETAKEYRLLSESEWEYVARGGTNTARYWGETEEGQCTHTNGADLRTGVGWAVSCDDRQRRTAPVGAYTANGYGLYDVIGNVWEWTQDCWNENYEGAPRDERPWVTGECAGRVFRGGGWGNISGYLRSAIRLGDSTGYRSDMLGFRVSRTL